MNKREIIRRLESLVANERESLGLYADYDESFYADQILEQLEEIIQEASPGNANTGPR